MSVRSHETLALRLCGAGRQKRSSSFSKSSCSLVTLVASSVGISDPRGSLEWKPWLVVRNKAQGVLRGKSGKRLKVCTCLVLPTKNPFGRPLIACNRGLVGLAEGSPSASRFGLTHPCSHDPPADRGDDLITKDTCNLAHFVIWR